jgi:diaminohydroxyphosphoribosylaminopyrimidine deaminase / 5-amino-6-(5-phosphoribosylamino)uracil reductase
MSPAEFAWMKRALALAERGRGAVEPNPLVGAVLVRDDCVVGEGWHELFGQAHAEVNALAQAGSKARGATLFCTLEPCCHHGKTSPCTEAILGAGVTRVVAAMLDPFSQVAGQGIARLGDAGVAVEIGLCQTEARQLNAPYLKLIETGRPYVHAKWAMTLDGKIATATGDSRWISGEESRRWVHELRGRVDAIIVGKGTVLADDPLLTARPPGPRTALRIVLDRTAALPLTSKLVRTIADAPLMVVTATSADPARAEALRAAGCEILPIDATGGVSSLGLLLDELGRRRFTNVLVEGGGGVLGSFHDAGLIDCVHVFVCPILLGGQSALSPIGGVGANRIADALRLENTYVERLGQDLLIHGHITRPQTGGLATRRIRT